MNKKIILIIILLVGGVAAFFFFKNSTKQVPNTTERAAVVRNDLPNIPIITSGGSQLSTRNLKGKTVLVVFLPDCDHCQREADQISKHLEAFKEYNVYFISASTFPALEKFSIDYNLAGHANIHFAQTKDEDILKHLGPIQTPSLYIHTNEGQLVKAFNGETAIEQILPYL